MRPALEVAREFMGCEVSDACRSGLLANHHACYRIAKLIERERKAARVEALWWVDFGFILIILGILGVIVCHTLTTAG